jgi:hypothetical protein
MGKRNLAIVGTHEDFCADILDAKTGLDPSIVTHCASAQDAATSYFDSVADASERRWWRFGRWPTRRR